MSYSHKIYGDDCAGGRSPNRRMLLHEDWSHVTFVNGFTPDRFMVQRILTLRILALMTVNATLHLPHGESRETFPSFTEARGILVESDVA